MDLFVFYLYFHSRMLRIIFIYEVPELGSLDIKISDCLLRSYLVTYNVSIACLLFIYLFTVNMEFMADT